MELPPLRPTVIQGPTGPGNPSQERLAEGRLFQAQVVQLLDGKSLVLAVGRERIAAASQAAFEVGQRLLLRVRGAGAGRVFELVGEEEFAAQAEPADGPRPSAHAFRLLAETRGLGELLEGLAGAVEPRQGEARTLASFAFEPGGSGHELAAKLADSGLGHEARALGRALERLPRGALAAAAEELVAGAFAALAAPDAALLARRDLAEKLARLLGEPGFLAPLHGSLAGPPGGAGARAPAALRLLAALGEALFTGTLRADVPEAVREPLRDLLAVARVSPRLARAVAEALLGAQAGLIAALDVADPTPPPSAPGSADLPDLKAWLASALEHADPGREVRALRGALDALEAEQLVALARSHAGEGSSWIFALRDGAAFADARLVHRRPEDRSAEDRGAEDRPGGRAGERAVLGLEFRGTGPVRADLLLEGSRLGVRVEVAREEVARRMQAGLEELRARLGADGRSVELTVGVRAAEDLRVPGPDSDLRLSGGRAAVDRLG